MMGGITRHDPSGDGYGKGVEGMLVLTELRLLFMPDISSGTATLSFLEFHTVQVRRAFSRNKVGVLCFHRRHGRHTVRMLYIYIYRAVLV